MTAKPSMVAVQVKGKQMKRLRDMTRLEIWQELLPKGANMEKLDGTPTSNLKNVLQKLQENRNNNDVMQKRNAGNNQ